MDFAKTIADVEQFLSDLKAAKSAAGPDGSKVDHQELVRLEKDGLRIAGDIGKAAIAVAKLLA